MIKFRKMRRKRSANITQPFSVLQQKPVQNYQSVELPERAGNENNMKTVLAELEVLRRQFAEQDQVAGEMEFVVPSPPK